MIWIGGRWENVVIVPTSRARLWARISTKEGLETLFPGVESITPYEDGWQWIMRPVTTAGIRVQPRITARFEFHEPDRVSIIPIEGIEKDTARMRGDFILEEAGERETRVTTKLDMELRLPIPWYAAPIARRIARTKVRKYADAFSENVRTATTRRK